VAVRAEPGEVVEGVHNRVRRVKREGRQRTLVADLDVLRVPAVDAPIGEGLEVLTPSVLPQASVPAGRMVGPIGDGTDRLRSIELPVRAVCRAVPVPPRNRAATHRAPAAGSSLRDQDVVHLGRTGAGAELRIPGLPTADRTFSQGNPEQVPFRSCRGHPVLADSSGLVQRLYGHRLNQDGKAKIQSSPRTLKGGEETRRGMKPGVAGSNPAGRIAYVTAADQLRRAVIPVRFRPLQPRPRRPGEGFRPPRYKDAGGWSE
jgi:hypothetical protein